MNKIVSFIKKYIGELSAITSLAEIVTAGLPLKAKDRDNVAKLIDSLQQSIENLSKAIPALEKEAKVVVKKEDIEAAVAKYLDAKEKASAAKK